MNNNEQKANNMNNNEQKANNISVGDSFISSNGFVFRNTDGNFLVDWNATATHCTPDINLALCGDNFDGAQKLVSKLHNIGAGKFQIVKVERKTTVQEFVPLLPFEECVIKNNKTNQFIKNFDTDSKELVYTDSADDAMRIPSKTMADLTKVALCIMDESLDLDVVNVKE